MKAKQIIDSYILFFKKRGHVQIANAALVPDNDSTTLFTSSGMQPLVPYLLGETHPSGTRLVNVQNCFRAVDIEEIGDNRHTTFFRMLGNWSLGDYFKQEQIPWVWEFLIKELGFDPKRLYITIFAGGNGIEKDTQSYGLWQGLLTQAGLDPQKRIFSYDAKKNWWSRSGTPDNMPTGEPGGPDSEIFYDFGEALGLHEKSQWVKEKCHVNCDCGRYIEICNSVFMQYKKEADGTLSLLRKPNVDFGGGLERLLLARENQPDIFQTTLLAPIIASLAEETQKNYKGNELHMRIATDHLIAASFISLSGVRPSNKEQGYILRRLIRRGIDHLYQLKEISTEKILTAIVNQYKDTDPILVEKFEEIKLTILTEEQKYAHTRKEAKKYIEKRCKGEALRVKGEEDKRLGDELMGTTKISAEDAFYLYTSHGLSPTQIQSLGYVFNEQDFAQKMEAHQKLSKTASSGKFKGGLADTQELTIKGHTATHLLQQALRDELGNHVFQTGSNITTERLRFDFSHPDKLTQEQIKKVETTVREKMQEDLPVHFEMMPIQQAKATGAIGLFDEKYGDIVKVYFIGEYSKELCGGPHVEHTGVITSFTITKQEKLGNGQTRIYATVS